MGHDIVAEFAFVFIGEVDFGIGYAAGYDSAELFNLFLGDGESEFVLGFRDGQPDFSPGIELVPRRPQRKHFCAGVAFGEGRGVGVVFGGHKKIGLI